MNDNAYFSSHQSGFLRLHSTVTCLLKNTDDWCSDLDLGKLVGLVFIDLKKKLLIQLAMTFSPESWSTMVFKLRNLPGLNLIFLTENNFLGLMVLTHQLGILILEYHKALFWATPFSCLHQ